MGHLLADPAVSTAQAGAATAVWTLAGSIAAMLFLVAHVAFALNAFGMIIASTSLTSEGRPD